ncbi:spermidine synthase-like protein [Kribbella qitaiheensis]|uniref:Spermidine synthase-like protein n=1 Tax=Kribbella qitaiheensis TaxID=1544730 RepID=A0A7G6X3F6_9ACTN|nr:fused MFS/spermidine synthase [Kribbella qitaiheensis]QNE20771.1 spermidine synthase-like protein [Kribbella qitaiheensis]
MERKVGSGVATVEADADGTFVLRVDGSLQSQVDLADPTHLSFEYVRRIGDVLDAVAERRQPISVLHVGGAGLTLARYVAATRPRSRQIVLEPDEDLTEFVRETLPLPKRAGIKVRPVTGRAGIAEVYPDSVDVVIVDAFVREAVPANLVTAEFVAECSRVLRPTGLLVLNLIDGSAGLTFVRRVAATLHTHLAPAGPAGASGRVGHGVVLAERKVLRGKSFGNVVLVGSAQPVPELADAGRRAQPPYEVLPLAELAGKAEPLTDADGFASPAAPAGTFGR